MLRNSRGFSRDEVGCVNTYRKNAMALIALKVKDVQSEHSGTMKKADLVANMAELYHKKTFTSGATTVYCAVDQLLLGQGKK